MEPENPLLDDFVLSLSRSQPARVCFIPTASGDAAPYITRFYRAFSGRGIPTDLTLFDSRSLPRWPKNTGDLASFVSQQDVFYIGGGNTAHLLALWRVHGLDVLLQDAWRRGAVLSGISAGMICWFQGGVTDSFGELRGLRDGLGILPGLACPHYDGEPGRRRAFHAFVSECAMAGYAAEDGAALHFEGTHLREVVSSRETAGAYRVSHNGGGIVEDRLPVRFLGARSTVGY